MDKMKGKETKGDRLRKLENITKVRKRKKVRERKPDRKLYTKFDK